MCPQRLISCWAKFQNSETSWDSSDLGKTFNYQVEVTSVLGKEEKPLPGTEGLSPPSLVPALACTRSLSSQSVLQSQIPVKAQRWEGRVSVGHQRVRYFLALTGSKKKLLDFCLWTPFDVPE